MHLLEPFLTGEEKLTSIPVQTQVLIALSIYATGNYQKPVGTIYFHPTSQATVQRCMESVTNALNRVAPSIIQMPKTAQQREQVQARLVNIIIIQGKFLLDDGKFVKATHCLYS